MDKAKNKISLKALVQSGVHFGHQTSRWSPKMKPYIWGSKNNIHLIDVSKTAYQLEKASNFLYETASKGEQILWVGTKKAAHPIVKKVAEELAQPYVVNRWIGGTLTNFRQVKKSVANLMHFEDILNKSDKYHYNKKELGVFKKRAEKLEQAAGGIRNLSWPIGALVVVDVKKEQVAIKEANSMGIPVVALVDTNSNPEGIDYVIPANDDSPKSISLLLNYLAEAAEAGQKVAKEAENKEQEKTIAKPKKETIKEEKPKDSQAKSEKTENKELKKEVK